MPSTVRAILDLPVAADFVEYLDRRFRHGRRGYSNRARVGMLLIKHLYELEDWTLVALIVPQMPGLVAAMECDGPADVPSEWACYRFNRKLREHPDLVERFDRLIVEALVELEPRLLEIGALDASDVIARANVQRYVRRGGPERKRFSDPDANWGHHSAKSARGPGGYGGYKLHALASAHPDPKVPEVVLAHQTWPARTNEQIPAREIIPNASDRGALPAKVVMDAAYDGAPLADLCENHRSIAIVPRVPQRRPTQKTAAEADYRPVCEHGIWIFRGADYGRRTTKWRCPAGRCDPKVVNLDAGHQHPLIPYKSKRWKDLYRLRPAVERVFSRLKEHHLLDDLRVQGLDRARLHCTYAVWAHNLLALLRLVESR